jgi:GT2 family glycosyltransferase
VVVIPTLNARPLLADCLDSLAGQTAAAEVVVVDNASSDDTAQFVASRHPRVRLVRLERNVGFGRAVNRGVAAADDGIDAIVLVNNDTVCAPDFVERILEPLSDPAVGLVAGVLVQDADPRLVDSAGIELDRTLRSWDIGWNRPVDDLGPGRRAPVGPCGGAAAYRAAAFREAAGFDESFFAYWEDVDLALRLRLAGWRCAAAPRARARHVHGATLGAASPAQRRLEAFGRGFVLARYRVADAGALTRLAISLLDWPVLLVHLLVRREAGPIRARAAGIRAGRAGTPLRAPLELAEVGLREALGRQLGLLGLRARGRLPAHMHAGASIAEDGGEQSRG